MYSPLLVSSTCSLLAAVVAELAASATGRELEVTSGASRPPLLVTPNRFTRTSSAAHWNTGNGATPDALYFSVDRPGIVIAGATVYGGGGSASSSGGGGGGSAGVYEYELELLDYVSG